MTPSIFNFDSSEVRTVTKNDEVWFVATDIAKILGYAEAKDMTRMLDEDEAGRHNVPTRSENGVEQNREMSIISEPGLYRACFRSEKEVAKKLTRWATHEVLPSIRRQGFYESPAYVELKARADEADRLEARVTALSEAHSIATNRLTRTREDAAHLQKIVDDIPVGKSERKDVAHKGFDKGVKDYRKIVTTPKAKALNKITSEVKKDLVRLVKYEVITEGTKQGLERHINKIEDIAYGLLGGVRDIEQEQTTKHP